MPTYAYRWADGSVSLCSARNKNDAMSRFDTMGQVSRNLILRLASPIFFTVRPSVDQWWALDEETPLEFLLSQEVEKKCYPNYHKAQHDIKPDADPGVYSKADKKKLSRALKQDEAEAVKRIESVFPTMDLIAMFPDGLPGQEN